MKDSYIQHKLWFCIVYCGKQPGTIIEEWIVV